MPKEEQVERELWNWKQANWEGLNEELEHTDWKRVLFNTESREPSKAHADAAVERFTSYLLDRAKQYVPVRTVTDTKSTHPWLNDR